MGEASMGAPQKPNTPKTKQWIPDMSRSRSLNSEDEALLSEEQRAKRNRLLESLSSRIFLPHLLTESNVPGLSLSQAHRGDVTVLYSAMMGRENPAAEAGGKRKRDVDTHAIGRPWDRGELYVRLQTFKSVTWFAKPKCVGAVECARRGWENTGADELTCETCRAVLVFPKDVDLDVMPAVVAAFQNKLETTHDHMCPWRSSVCSMSLLEFPTTLPDMTMLADFESRAAALKKLVCIPPISREAVEVVLAGGENAAAVGRLLAAARGARGARLEKKKKEECDRVVERLSQTQHFDRDDTVARATFLALCGWSLRTLNPGTPSSQSQSSQSPPSPSVDGSRMGHDGHIKPTEAALQCTMCGTRVGLWSFFGEGKTPSSAFASPLTGPRSTTGTGTGSLRAASSIAVNNQVAMNLRTTIAGGLLHGGFGGFGGSGQTGSGPFGGPQAAAGAFSYTGSAGSGGNLAGTAHVRPTTTTATNPSSTREARILASYKSSCRAPVDPLDAHRSFCPWAAAATETAKPGWQVYLAALETNSR